MSLFTTSMAALLGVTVVTTSGPLFSANTTNVKVATVEKPKLAQTSQQQSPAPTPGPLYVTVQPGDFLEKIAVANGTTSLRLFYANTEIVNPDLVYPEQKLRIPTAEETLAPREVPVNQQIVVPAAPQAARAPAPRQAAAPAAPRPAANFAAGDGSVWDKLAVCESGGNWAINTGNGYFGGLQFSLASWRGVGGTGYPHEASREEQIARGQMLQARQGWGAWPACTAKLGIR